MDPETQDRRATIFPRSGLKRGPSINDENRSTAKLARKIPVIPTVPTPRKASEDPWKRYKSILEFHQAGPATLVHRNSSTFQEFIAKETKGDKDLLSKIQRASHKNIVCFHEALYDRGSLFFIYEVMEVSLAQVFATPQGCLRPYEVAAFSAEILQGLHYIHNELRIAHGNLSAENVLVSMNGDVKIGDSMLKENFDLQSDILELGAIILMCLEPGTHLRKTGRLTQEWDTNLTAFHNATTQTTSSQKLLEHDFLKLSPGPQCLKPLIRTAREVSLKDVKIL